MPDHALEKFVEIVSTTFLTPKGHGRHIHRQSNDSSYLCENRFGRIGPNLQSSFNE